MDAIRIIGRAPEALTLAEKAALAGQWIALEIYRPETLPLRRIQAIGRTVGECIAGLRKRGLDPRDFEFTPLS